MKTIECVSRVFSLNEVEKLKEHDLKELPKSFAFAISMESFREGVEFAQRWIPIEDELPETNKKEEGILYSEYVLVKVKGYDHPFVGYYVKACDDEFFDFISESTSKSIKQSDITHWRPIEYI